MQNDLKTLSYENDVLQFIHEVLEELTLRTSPVERDLYIRQLSEETNISVEAIQQQFMKMAGNRARQAKAEPRREGGRFTVQLNHQSKKNRN